MTVELRASEEEERVAFYGRRPGGPWRLLAHDRHGSLVLARGGESLDALGLSSLELADLVVNSGHLRPGGRSPEVLRVVEGAEPVAVLPTWAGATIGLFVILCIITQISCSIILAFALP